MMILLFPIFGFMYCYLAVSDRPALAYYPNQRIVAGTILALWAISFIFFNKKIKRARKGQGLRVKLEEYFSITIVRFSIFAICSLILSVAFYLTGDDFYSISFIVQLGLCALLWPRSTKVSDDLKLRGDEREMVYYKKDTL